MPVPPLSAPTLTLLKGAIQSLVCSLGCEMILLPRSAFSSLCSSQLLPTSPPSPKLLATVDLLSAAGSVHSGYVSAA